MSDKSSKKSSDKSKKAPRADKPQDNTARRDGRADHVVVRNLFALSVVRRAVFLSIVSAVCAGLSLLSAFQVFSFRTPPQYIQLTEDGRIYPVAPLAVANVNNGEIIQFATDSIKWINTYDFKSWKDQLQNASARFTPQGWSGYLSELTATGTMNTVQSQKMVAAPVFTGPAQITKTGVISSTGQYSWVVDVPVNIYLESAAQDKTAPTIITRGVVTLYIVRVPLEINLRGYAIQAYQFDTTRTENKAKS